MSDPKQELISFRLRMAEEAYSVATLAATQKFWNTVAGKLYYTCYYLVIALFAKNDIKTSTHSGVKTILSLKFIKTGILHPKWGRFFSNLYDIRQESDYRDFKIYEEEEVLPLLEDVKEFRDLLMKLIEDQD